MDKLVLVLFFSHLLLPILPAYLFIRGAENHLSLYIILSRIAGIYAFVWYSMQFILTARLRLLEKIDAQDKRMVLHMILSLCALAAVLVHTALGNEKAASELQAGFGGTADTVFLYAILFSSLFFSNYFIRFVPNLIPYRDKIKSQLNLTYERCQMLHYAMPAGMVILTFHILLLPGNTLLGFKVCMTAISCIGLSVFLIHKFYIPKRARKTPWKVSKIIKESDAITTVFFEHPAGPPLNHLAGQFCYLCPVDTAIPKQFHPFTISSGSREGQPSITFKAVGDFTGQLKDIQIGARVAITGPYGRFSCGGTPAGNALVFIAGGIGITPMLSMLKDLSSDGSKREIMLIWGVRSATDFIRYDALKTLTRQMENFVFEPVVSGACPWEGRRGRISKALLTELLEIHHLSIAGTDHASIDFFVCGPPSMAAAVCNSLKELGANRGQIHTEGFAF